MAQSVAFLDRDGTLNVDVGYVGSLDRWRWTDRAIEAVQLLNRCGYLVAIVTNQSGIAAGRVSRDEMELLHTNIQTELAAHGARVDCFAICPHAETDTCQCRKPRIGLAHVVERALGQPIDYGRSWTIGDKLSDVKFGRCLGTHTAIIRSTYWKAAELEFHPNLIGDSLFDCVTRICDLGAPFA